METRDRNVCDPYMSVMASAYVQLDGVLHIYYVDDLARIGTDRLQNDKAEFFVIHSWLGYIVLDDIEEFLAILTLGLIRVGRLAQLTLKVLPKVSRHNRRRLHDSLAVEPLFEAQVVDETHRSGTLAGSNQRVIIVILFAQANTT